MEEGTPEQGRHVRTASHSPASGWANRNVAIRTLQESLDQVGGGLTGTKGNSSDREQDNPVQGFNGPECRDRSTVTSGVSFSRETSWLS